MISQKDIHTFEEKHRILLRTNEFICLLPHPNVREYISNYNITFPTRDIIPNGFTAIPSGCATISIENNNQNLSVHLDGPGTKPYTYGSQVNQLNMIVTIEFKPAGLYALTGIPQSHLADQSLSFEVIDLALSKLLSDAIEKAGNIYELINSLDTLLLENMYTTHCQQLMPALQNIIACSGNISIQEVSDNIHYSQRQLNRIFKQHVGVSAKSFSRLLRINKSFRLLKKADYSIMFISDVMAFYDLSHFARDFKSVCGVTPQEYRNNMSDFYINTSKF
ncbi:MAG: helix-turn-helix transcriptional regulator [Oscillospiraceae bacterium]|nr:helix-turn-helix transcriptional regulator [Oscillospiraceae bacterium]